MIFERKYSEEVKEAETKKDDQRLDFSQKYSEAIQETLRVIYSQRNKDGDTTENINQIIYRVAISVAIAELKYCLKPAEIIWIELKDALIHPQVIEYTKKFAEAIGNQKFWANTPANVNADPETSLNVLKYWAYGKKREMKEENIWLVSDKLADSYEKQEYLNPDDELPMAKLAYELRGKGCLAACGVAYLVDSLEGIQEAARMEALATKAAMGMGLNTSKLRPWSSVVANGAAASGPDRFYEKTISKAVEAVAQGGRRGGALIELRNSDHPDILIFIEKKRLKPKPEFAKIFKQVSDKNQKTTEQDEEYKRKILALAEDEYGQKYHEYLERQNYLKNTNISVLVMPGFMQAVMKKTWYQCTFEGKPWIGPIYDPKKDTGKINPLTKEKLFEEYSVDLKKYPEAVHNSLRGHLYAPEVFDRIVEGMVDSGEPGILFYDTINKANANNHIYDLNTCNPCGEQNLPAGLGKDGNVYTGNCNLSSLNAAHESFWFEDGSYNTEEMRNIVKLQQRFMDNVTDVSWYPLVTQNYTARMERRNGGGFAGVAEYISLHEIRFGSEDSHSLVKNLFQEYNTASIQASMDLAKERGTYPLWKGSEFEKQGHKVRNACMTNNAPTGTLAQAMGTSFGIEPHTGIVFSRKVRYRSVDFVAPGFEYMMKKYNAWPATKEDQEKLKQEIRANGKSVQGLKSIPEQVQHAFPIRAEIDPLDYIDHLAAVHDAANFNPYVFNSVSNTCAIPQGFDSERVKQAIIRAYKKGVKALTFYPDGSRLSQPIEQIAESKNKENKLDLLGMLNSDTCAVTKIDTEETGGDSYKIKIGTPDGTSTLHISCNHLLSNPGQLIEIYARIGKPGTLESCLFEALGRVCSAFLQFAAQFGSQQRQIAEDIIIKQLINMQSGYVSWHRWKGEEKQIVISSPCDGLAQAMLRYRNKYMNAKITEVVNEKSGEIISKVDSSICLHTKTIKIDGCKLCEDCGYSRC